jgi:hypothetical protein
MLPLLVKLAPNLKLLNDDICSAFHYNSESNYFNN